jgi:hypothetical protein
VTKNTFNPLRAVRFNHDENHDEFVIDLSTHEGAEMLVIFVEALSRLSRYELVTRYLTDAVPQRDAIAEIHNVVMSHKEDLLRAKEEFTRNTLAALLGAYASDDEEGH